MALYDAGHRHFGENYIQELSDKAKEVSPSAPFRQTGGLRRASLASTRRLATYSYNGGSSPPTSSGTSSATFKATRSSSRLVSSARDELALSISSRLYLSFVSLTFRLTSPCHTLPIASRSHPQPLCARIPRVHKESDPPRNFPRLYLPPSSSTPERLPPN
jgi:hypothetical protein